MTRTSSSSQVYWPVRDSEHDADNTHPRNAGNHRTREGAIHMMRHAIRFIPLFAFVAAALCAAPVSAIDNLTLNVPLPSQSVTVGETVTVTLDVSQLLQPINGIQAFLQFDPAMLQLNTITPNSAAGDLASGWIVGQENIIGGSITYIVALFADATAADDLVATLTFTAVGAGATQVVFDPAPPTPSKLTGSDNATIFPTLLNSQTIVIDAGTASPSIQAIDVFYVGRFADAADPSQTCLAVGTTAVSRNITNHMSGITGIRLRFSTIVAFATTPADAFSFEWTTGADTTFTPISAPAGTVSVTATDGGVTTVDIVFEDNLIRRRWLKVVVDAAQITAGGVTLDGELQGNPVQVPSGNGTAGGDAVFFLGNLAGDVDGNQKVEFLDAVLARSQLNPFLFVPIDNASDIDKDGKVLFFDAVQARVELNPFFALPLISP